MVPQTLKVFNKIAVNSSRDKHNSDSLLQDWAVWWLKTPGKKTTQKKTKLPKGFVSDLWEQGNITHLIAGWIVREADSRIVVNMQEGYQEALLGSVTIKQDWEET